jgi:hypothetical protein
VDDRVHRYRFLRAGETEPRVDAMWWDNGGHGSGAKTITILLPEHTDHVNIYEWDGRVSSVAETDTLITTVSHLGRLYEYVPAIIGVDPTPPVVAEARLAQNAPNPFGPVTTIGFTLDAENGDARVEIYDTAGRLVRSIPLGDRRAGPGHVRWDGRDGDGSPLPSGTYFYRLAHARGRTEARTAYLVR